MSADFPFFQPLDPNRSWADYSSDEDSGVEPSAAGTYSRDRSWRLDAPPFNTEVSANAGRVDHFVQRQPGICFQNKRYGTCSRGNECQYEHIRETPYVCKHWKVKKEKCPFGIKCERDHGRVEVNINDSKFPVWCLNAVDNQTNSCSYGRKCTYLHPEDVQIYFIPEQ